MGTRQRPQQLGEPKVPDRLGSFFINPEDSRAEIRDRSCYSPKRHSSHSTSSLPARKASLSLAARTLSKADLHSAFKPSAPSPLRGAREEKELDSSDAQLLRAPSPAGVAGPLL